MIYKNILTELESSILTVTINRPDKLNALNAETLEELNAVFTSAEDDESIRGIIITGAGDKAFVAGADISELAGLGSANGTEMARKGQQNVFNLIENLSKPVVAAINGFALGGGLELALACHLRVATDAAKMGLPELSLGLIPGYGGTQRLTQLVGKGLAMEMVLTGKKITAEQAQKSGLVNHTVGEVDELLPFCVEMFEEILPKAPLAIASAIKTINAFTDKSLNGFDLEIDEFGKLFDTVDFKEGTSAFLEKRKPQFRGR